MSQAAAEPCCTDWANCQRPCTPRGTHEATKRLEGFMVKAAMHLPAEFAKVVTDEFWHLLDGHPERTSAVSEREPSKDETTLCWKCCAVYPIAADKCPKCAAANGNVDFNKAQAEVFAPPAPPALGTPRTDNFYVRSKWSYEAILDLSDFARTLERDFAEAKELTRMQLAACDVVTMQNTRESAKERIDINNPYWTPAYHGVCNAIDREMRERERAEAAESALAEWQRNHRWNIRQEGDALAICNGEHEGDGCEEVRFVRDSALAEAVAALRIAEEDLREERAQNGQFGAGA